jgi:hypothetical protein
LVIADLSFHNPNVFYEIGIRHMAVKPIIHMQLLNESPPFDVSLFRLIKFSREQYSDLQKAKADLKSTIQAVIADGYQVTNPVTNALGYLELERAASPETRVLMGEIEGIKSRLDEFERIALQQYYINSSSYAIPPPSGPAELSYRPTAGLGEAGLVRAGLGGVFSPGAALGGVFRPGLGMVSPGAGLGGGLVPPE